jgi:hypothetical protein
VSLPGRLARSPACRLLAVTLIFVPHTALEHVPTAAADNLVHGCHRLPIDKLVKMDKNAENERNYMEFFNAWGIKSIESDVRQE